MNLAVRPRYFYGTFLPIWYCINLSFWYLDALCSAATGVHVAFHMLRLLDGIPDIKKLLYVDNNAQPCLCSYYPSDFRK
jgi:hypothetical protein